MPDSWWTFLTSHISDKLYESIGSAIAAGLLAYWQRKPLVRLLRRLFGRRRFRLGTWHTVFLKNGQPRIETVKLRSLPVINLYYGTAEYNKSGQQRHYLFSGRLSQDLFTATYASEEDKANDCGAWTLKLNNTGTALVGAYIWQEVNDEIGHDFYQWTEAEFESLLRISNSSIDGNGVFATHPLPKGALVGKFRGAPVAQPTRESIRINGRHIDPANDCTLRSLNHSCTPNAKFSDDLLFLTEAVGEDEITIDYRQTETAFHGRFDCHCPECIRTHRQVIIGA